MGEYKRRRGTCSKKQGTEAGDRDEKDKNGEEIKSCLLHMCWPVQYICLYMYKHTCIYMHTCTCVHDEKA